VLTPEGWQAVAFARELLNATEDLRSDLRATGAHLHGRLRVGMIDAASLYVLPDAIHSFRTMHAGVDLELTVASSTPLLDGLRTLEQDIVYVTGPVDEPGLSTEVIRREPLFLYGPGEGDPATGDWVLYPDSSRTRSVIDRFFVDVGWTPRVILESANPAVLSQMVGLGFGWAVLPEAVAETRSDPLRKHRPDAVAHRLLVAVWRVSAEGNPRVEAFRSVVEGGPAAS
jgi:DNA-binding transcriptional LysR family regulator